MSLPTEDKARKELPLWTFFIGYFPKAWLAVLGVSVTGNKQHNPGQPLHWAREKSTDQMNTMFRHLFDYGCGVRKDTDGQYHLAKAIWRLSAQLQLDIEADEKETAAIQAQAHNMATRHARDEKGGTWVCDPKLPHAAPSRGMSEFAAERIGSDPDTEYGHG